MSHKISTSQKQNKKSVYIAGDFIDSQLLYIIPLAVGYAEQTGAGIIVFDKELPSTIRCNPLIIKALTGKRVLVINQCKYKTWNIIKKMAKYVSVLDSKTLAMAFGADRQKLLSEKRWYEKQLLHGVWDTAYLNSSDGTYWPSLYRRLESAIAVRLNIRFAHLLVTKYNVKAAFLGHVVYGGRALAAELNRSAVDVITQAAFVIYRVPKNYDTRWSFISKKLFRYVVSDPQSMSFSIEYWNQRLLGLSAYADARNAANKGRIIDDPPKNIVFLHVFRDSPFNYIDNERIFGDFIDWIEKTLMIIARSTEEWLVKPHPSAMAWGEDQVTWLELFKSRFFKGIWPSNIRIEPDLSNIDLLTRAKRIVTYHGTVHLEAACLGIKPIVISDATLSIFRQSMVNQPRSLIEYESMLLRPASDEIFKINDHETDIAKMLLYIREKILPFGSDMGSVLLRRQDHIDKFTDEYKSVEQNIESFYEHMILFGSAFAQGIPNTVSLQNSKQWIKRFVK